MFRKVAPIVIVALFLVNAVSGQELIVGVKPAPPFVIEEPGGNWDGITISLWKALANELNLEYRFVKRDLSGLIEEVSGGNLDVAAAALTITSERETKIDFTHPFYTTGLGIAVPANRFGWLATVQQFFSLDFLKVVLSLLCVLLIFGLLVWFFERRRNRDEFGGNLLQGIGSGLWWSAVTMTTVGYGDKAPRTLCGRVVALVWMFAGIIIISSFTAAITSTLTVGRLTTSIEGPNDLYGLRIWSVPNSTSAAYLDRKGFVFTPATSLRECLAALAEGNADAVVYDAPILKYHVNDQWQGRVRVLSFSFEKQNYGFGLPQGSQLREPLNRALLAHLSEAGWQNLVESYLGHDN
ncbi:MAG: transporter substrate-binding domain-containing protein [Deltaproteobacteria bacterium]|jgi:ABC-type amino acid transport substrate-binding protein|nr:transporter substrate-binding domain-containing protein [Deltaproteobacteria bacterium]